MNGREQVKQQTLEQTAQVSPSGESQYPPAASSQTQKRFCGNCGWPVREGGDLCEGCGAWMLVGQCVFCYGPVGEGQRFCGHCGASPTGVTCACGRLSIFDFCPDCQRPLTKAAEAELTQLRAELESLSSPSETTGSAAPSTRAERARVALEALRAITQGEQVPEVSPAPNSSVLERLKSASGERFETPQQARRRFAALRVLMPVFRVSAPKYWRCNAFGSAHSSGPSDCARPDKGGEWIGEDIVEELQELKL